MQGQRALRFHKKYIQINRQDSKLNSTVAIFWIQPSAICNWGTAHSPNEATMTSSTVLNTELTTIRAIIPAERTSVHWLHSERQRNSVWVCVFRVCLGDDGVMLNCADHKAWSVAFNCLIHSQRLWVVWSGEQSCYYLARSKKCFFLKADHQSFLFQRLISYHSILSV